MNKKDFQIMMFLYSAIEDGWKVKKNNDTNNYVFSKKHENKREIFHCDYLEKFVLNHSFFFEKTRMNDVGGGGGIDQKTK